VFMAPYKKPKAQANAADAKKDEDNKK
jgi:hypothetical protein